MALRGTQFGRLGDFGLTYLSNQLDVNSDPDQLAAHLYASDVSFASARPTVQEILDTKGMLDHRSDTWRDYSVRFKRLKDEYDSVNPLSARCVRRVGGTRFRPISHQGRCRHEIIPPPIYYNLNGFVRRELDSLSDTVRTRDDGTLLIPQHIWPMWNFVITLEGEILIGQEDYDLIKHTCIAGGRLVFSAGRVGIEANLIRLIDLQSGHYILPNENSIVKESILRFTREVFLSYSYFYNVREYMSDDFTCVWLSTI